MRPGAGDPQRVHVFPRRVPNGKQGGGQSWGMSVLGAVPPSPPQQQQQQHLQESRRAVGPAAGRGHWLSGPGCGEAGAAPGAYLPFRNIIPGGISTPGGRGGGGAGRGRGRGRRFPPGSSSPPRRLPLAARGGGWTEGCSVYPEGCMSRGNGPRRSQIFKNPQAPHPHPRQAGRATVGDPEAPGARNLTSARAGNRGGRRSGSGHRQAGPGGAIGRAHV